MSLGMSHETAFGDTVNRRAGELAVVGASSCRLTVSSAGDVFCTPKPGTQHTSDVIPTTRARAAKPSIGELSFSCLRPSGIADVDGERVDVVSDGEFIERGTQIIVTRVEGNRIVVRRQRANIERSENERT